MSRRLLLGVGAVFTVCAVMTMSAQTRPAAPSTTPRIYVFDGGSINGLDTKLFGFERSEIKEPNFRITSYLIVHPRGTLMWDSGGIPDASFPADGSEAKEGVMVAPRKLLPQLAAVGYKPSDV